jgi:P2-related tail formation protein
MTAVTKASAKAYFNTGDKPTQAEFEDLIDSYQDASTVLTTLSTVLATAGGLVRVSAGEITTVSAGTAGLQVLAAVTTAAAQQALGGSTLGRVVYEIASTAALQSQVFTGMVEAISGQIESPVSGQVYVLDHAASYPYTVNSLITRSSAGSGTFAAKIDGTNITGLATVGISAAGSNSAAATGANSVATSARLTLVATGLSSAADFAFTMKITRT